METHFLPVLMNGKPSANKHEVKFDDRLRACEWVGFIREVQYGEPDGLLVTIWSKEKEFILEVEIGTQFFQAWTQDWVEVLDFMEKYAAVFSLKARE